MKRFPFITSLLLISCILAGCSSGVVCINSDQVDQNYIFQYYKVRYHEDTKTMRAEAAFHLDNTTGDIVKLSGKAEVLFGKDAMSWQKDGFYTAEKSGFSANPDFHYVNNDGQSFDNKLKINTIEFKKSNIVLTKGAKNSIDCKGKQLDNNESAYLLLKVNESDVEVQGDFNKGTLVLDADALINVESGTYTGYLIRKNYDSDVNSLERGGVWESEYYSNQQQITIK